MSVNIEKYGDVELYNLLKKDKETASLAFAELYARYSSRIYAYCKRFLGNTDEAKDAFQEVFVRFFQSTEQEREMTNIPAFLLTIARNYCFNSLRLQRDNVKFEDYMSSSVELNDNEELLKLVKMAIDLLPDEYREMIILREYDGLTYLQIADVTQNNIATVKIKLHRARQKIRDILQPYLSEMSKY